MHRVILKDNLASAYFSESSLTPIEFPILILSKKITKVIGINWADSNFERLSVATFYDFIFYTVNSKKETNLEENSIPKRCPNRLDHLDSGQDNLLKLTGSLM